MSARLYSKAVVVLGAAVLVAGCLLGDLDGIAGPATADDGGPDEGGTLGDANVEGGSLTDGATESSSDAALDAASPCVAMHAFCADFDEATVDQGFSKTLDVGMGAVSQGGLNLSPPHSLHAMTPRKTDPASWSQALDKFFNSGWRRTRFQGDIYLMPIDWQTGDANVAFASVSMLSSTGGTGTVWFQSAKDSTATIEDTGGGHTRYQPVDVTPSGQWVHVMVDFDPAGHLHFELDGKAYDRDFPAFVAGANPAIDIQVGILDFNHPVPAIDVHWDNVFVDFP